jgi:HlyD family secretion protein
MKRWRWPLVGVAVLVLVWLVLGLAKPRGVTVQVAEVKRGDLVVPVQCDGTLEPPPGGELRSPEAATVKDILVHEGDRVNPGRILLTLSTPELSQKALDARAEALRLRAELESARVELANALREEKHHREVYEGDQRLLANGAITRAAAEADERALQQAEGTLAAARARLSGLEGKDSRLALAERAADDLEKRAGALTVRAASSGVVYGLPRRPGEAVAAGQVIASVVDPERRRVRARVDQPDLPRIAPGQKMYLAFDGLPRERWEGKVSEVAPGLRDVGGREVGEVLGEVSDPKGKLPTNAAVDVQIVTGEKSGTLVVPRAAVIRDGDRRFVYLLEDGRARRRDVEVGLLGLSEVEVTTGLKEKDRVILPGAATLSDGLRVQTERG